MATRAKIAGRARILVAVPGADVKSAAGRYTPRVMKRQRLKVLTGISLVWLAGCGFFWARSLANRDELGLLVSNGRLQVGSVSHRLCLSAGVGLGETFNIEGCWGQRQRDGFEPGQLLPSTERELLWRRVLIPFWMLMLPGVIAPVVMWRRKRPGRSGKLPRKRTGRRKRGGKSVV